MRISAAFTRALVACTTTFLVVLGAFPALATTARHHGAPGSIAGQIVEAGTGTGLFAYVTIRNRSDGHVVSFDTASDGTFRQDGLLPGDYDVCAYGYPGADPYGYVSRCHGSPQWWHTSTPTSHSVAVTVNAGSVTSTGIALPDAGAISGRLRDARTGHPLDFADISVFQHGALVVSWTTDSGGRYEVDGLPQSTGSNGFQICFWISQDYAVSQPTGWAPQCWRNRQWSRVAGYPPATRSARVAVFENAMTSGINATLLRGAAISGVVRSAAPGHPALRNSRLAVFHNGANIGETSSNSRGRFRLHSLPPGRYVVCAAGGTLAGAPHARFGARCWRNLRWNGRTAPAGAPTVSTSNGAIHTGVNLVLPRR